MDLLRPLRDAFKAGVESRANSPVVYMDPNALDSWAAERVLKLKSGQELSRQDIMAKGILARQTAEQLDTQSPGLSSKFSAEEIEALYIQSLVEGPFVAPDMKKLGVNIVNMPKNGQLDKEKILYQTFSVIKKNEQHNGNVDPNDPYDPANPDNMPAARPFNPEHIRPLPGSTALWKELVGEHEGEHVNQDLTQINNQSPSHQIQSLELGADNAALANMRARGHYEVAQAFTDMRTIAASNGDYTHATSILLNKADHTEASDKHFSAAVAFTNEMISGVSAELKIPYGEARNLRTADPQKFVRTLDRALENGRIPAPQEMSFYEKQQKVAREMGLTEDEFEKLGPDRIPDILESYDKLKEKNAFQNPPSNNPHIREYAEEYSAAVKRFFIEDTTPGPGKMPSPSVIPKRSTEEVIAALSPEELKNNAKNQLHVAMYESVAERLNITRQEATNYYFGNPDQKARFYEALEAQLKEGNIKGSIHRTKTETEARLKEALSVTDEEFKRIKEEDPARRDFAYDRLLKDGALTVKYDNPQLNLEVQYEIDNYRRNLEAQKELETAGSAPAEATKPETEQEAPPPVEPEKTPEQLSALKQSPTQTAPGSYDYLRTKEVDTGNGTPQIELRNGDNAQMRIGELKPREYFALQADPALAQDRTPAQQPQPEYRHAPTPQQPALRIQL